MDVGAVWVGKELHSRRPQFNLSRLYQFERSPCGYPVRNDVISRFFCTVCRLARPLPFLFSIPDHPFVLGAAYWRAAPGDEAPLQGRAAKAGRVSTSLARLFILPPAAQLQASIHLPSLRKDLKVKGAARKTFARPRLVFAHSIFDSEKAALEMAARQEMVSAHETSVRFPQDIWTVRIARACWPRRHGNRLQGPTASG